VDECHRCTRHSDCSPHFGNTGETGASYGQYVLPKYGTAVPAGLLQARLPRIACRIRDPSKAPAASSPQVSQYGSRMPEMIPPGYHVDSSAILCIERLDWSGSDRLILLLCHQQPCYYKLVRSYWILDTGLLSLYWIAVVYSHIHNI